MSGGGDTNVPETPLETAQANVAKAQYADYQKRWLPVQQQFIARTEGNEGAKKAASEGAANVDVQGRFGDAQQGLNTSLSNRGALPGSGKSIFGNTKFAGDKGQAAGLTRTNVDDVVDRQYMSGLQDIVSMGRGQRATSDQALSTIAGLSGQEATANAEASAQDAAGAGEAIGTGIGIGGSYLLPKANQTPSGGRGLQLQQQAPAYNSGLTVPQITYPGAYDAPAIPGS